MNLHAKPRRPRVFSWNAEVSQHDDGRRITAPGTRPFSVPEELSLYWRRAWKVCSETSDGGERKVDHVSWERETSRFSVGAFGLRDDAHVAMLMATMLRMDPMRYVHVMRDSPFYPKVAMVAGEPVYKLWWHRKGIAPVLTVGMISCLLSCYPSDRAQATVLRTIADGLPVPVPSFGHTLEYKRLWAFCLAAYLRSPADDWRAMDCFRAHSMDKGADPEDVAAQVLMDVPELRGLHERVCAVFQ